MPQIKIGKGIGDISEQTLRFYRQIGVDAVGMPTRWRTEPGTGRTQTPYRRHRRDQKDRKEGYGMSGNCNASKRESNLMISYL